MCFFTSSLNDNFLIILSRRIIYQIIPLQVIYKYTTDLFYVKHFFQTFGNGKRHHIPLFKGLELKNLLIIGEVRFKVLEEYVRRSLFFYKGRKNRKKPELKTAPIRNKYQLDLSPNRHSYESSKIWATRQGLWWRWQRVREWFSEFGESYEM